MITNFKKINVNQIANDNDHLQDLLDNEEYIEIGTINNKVMNDLLAGKLIKLEDLSYFQIQNIGLGKCEADLDENNESQDLRNILPFVNLQNKLQNLPSSIAIITYGVIIQKFNRISFSSHEEFTPMILIPVQMYFDKGLSFQMIASPFPNPNISIVRKASNIIIRNENLNSLYGIDHFCMNYNAFAEVRLECYVTYVKLKQDNYNFTDKYYHSTLNFYNVDHRYNIKNERILNITRLNKNQRVALERAHDGQSFEIIGADGTGKTTALINVACDAIHNGKRVLYLSNSINTLKSVYNLLDEKGLASMASRLYLPFNELKERVFINKRDKKEVLVENQKIKNELFNLYENSDKYIAYLYKRINNFYIIDVLNNCIKYKDLNPKLNNELFDGIDSIYREEIPQIEQALESIDKGLVKMPSISDSSFATIPTTVDAYADEITSLLRDISISYKKIENLKKKLVNDYKCIDVENYALLRSFLGNYNALDKTLVPLNWLKHEGKNLTGYNYAKEVFENFKSEMNSLEERKKSISDNYYVDILETYNIEKYATVIYNKFKNYDNRTINKFLKENAQLIEILSTFIKEINHSSSNYSKMNSILQCKINFSNDLLVEQIIAFMMFIEKNSYSKQWVFTNNKDGIKNRINKLRDILDEYDEKKKLLGISEVSNLTEYIDSLKIRAKLRFNDKKLKDYIKKLEKLQHDYKGIDQSYSEYFDLTGEHYRYEFNPIKNFDKFCNLFEQINDEKIKKSITKLIYTKPIDEVRELIKPFIDFGEYYVELNKKHKLICSYYLTTEKTNSGAKEKDIEDAYEYCLRVKSIQDKVMSTIKEKHYVILLEDINILRTQLNDKKAIEKSIDGNEEYRNYLSTLYTGYNSDVRVIANLFEQFDYYCKDFVNFEAVTNSFKNPIKIGKDIEECTNTCADIMNYIKNYTKYFREDIDGFYYNMIEEVYNRIDGLLKKEDELIIYLDMIKSLNVLKKNDLNNLYDHIMELKNNKKKINYKDEFLKGYFDNLLRKFKEKSNDDLCSKDNYTLLDDILHKEDELIESNIELFKSELKSRFAITNLRNMDYSEYADKTIGEKFLFLSTPLIYNLFLDTVNFDCVIIDDAQILNVNEYRKALQHKQVIVSGTPLLSYGINNDLLSNMKRTAVVKLTYRYYDSPLSLLTEETNVKGKIYQNVEDNKGIIYSRVDIKKICEEILNDEGSNIFNIKMNIFIESENKISELYDHFASLLRRRYYSVDRIIDYFNSNLNICSIKKNYAIDADYNIIDLSDYIYVTEANDISNYFNILQICKRKLIICDEGNVLNEDANNEFSKRISKLLKCDFDFKKNYPDDSIQKIIEKLKENNCRCLGSVGNYALIFSKNKKLYGTILFDLESLRESNVLNLYRNIYYGGYIQTKCLFLFDLEHNFDDCINQLLTMTEDNNDPRND